MEIEPKKEEGGIGLDDFEKFMKEYEVDRIRTEFSGRVITLIIASLGLLTALAWDDTLRDLFRKIFGEASTLGEKFIYSLLITLIAVIISVVLGRIFIKNQEKK